VSSRRAAAVPCFVALLATACGGDGDGGSEETLADADEVDCQLEPVEADGELTVYSGRNEELVGPLLEQYASQTGVDIAIDYGGDSATMARQISEEGDASPADVFFSQAPGPLAFLGEQGRLDTLPDSVLDKVPEQYRAADGTWVGASGRVRVLVHDPERTPADTLPASVFDLIKPEYRGKLGIAPSNASFQDFVSYLRIAIGEDETMAFLEGLVDNDVRTYPNNVAIVEAVDSGEIDMGLANHYYVLELLAQDESLTTRNHYFPAEDPGAIILVAGASVLDTADDPELASQFVEFLVSECAQRYFVDVTKEFSVIPGVQPPGDERPLEAVGGEVADLAELGAGFESTADLIAESGLEG